MEMEDLERLGGTIKAGGLNTAGGPSRDLGVSWEVPGRVLGVPWDGPGMVLGRPCPGKIL